MTAVEEKPEVADGRTRRSLRSREAIVDAMFELVGDGTLQPTAQQVAQRGGVGIRTVFRHFEDMDSLYAAMNQRLLVQAIGIMTSREPKGSLTTRGRELVALRATLFERIAPYRRCGDLHRWRSPYLQAEHARMVRSLRADLLRWLPELKAAPSDVVGAFELVTSFEAWDRLRREQRLGRDRAQAVVEQLVADLVGSRL